MEDARDPLDEEAYDPLDEPVPIDEGLVRGGPDPEEGFPASAAVARERASRLVARPRARLGSEAALRSRKMAFVRALANSGGNVSMACAASGMSPDAARRHRKADDAFAESWDLAVETAHDALHAAAYGRAVHGVLKEHWRLDKEGVPVMTHVTTEHSDRLLELLLKAAKPEVYRESHRADAGSGGGGGVLLLPSDVPLHEWEASTAIQQAQYRERREED